MTQALINNLNILSEKKVNLTEKMSKGEGMDFGKIFEAKTDKFSRQTNNVNKDNKDINKNNSLNTNKNQIETAKKTNPTNGEEIKINNTNSTKNDTNGTSNTDTTDVKDVKDLKDDNKITDQTSKDNDNNNIESLTEDDVSKILHGVIQEFSEDTEDNIISVPLTEFVENTDDEDIEITENTTDESVITDDTITEEAPTMYKEFITLENPTAFTMLQSQLTQTANLPSVNAQAETVIEENYNAQTALQDSNTNSQEMAVFKKLDTILAKDAGIIANAQKQTFHAKADNNKVSNLINENMLKELNVEVISSQAAEAEASMGDLMQNQTPQEQTARIMIQGDIKYDAVAAEVSKSAAQPKLVNVTPSKIIEQVTKQMESLFNNSKLNMVLNPGSLGKLNLQIVNTKEGLLAQFTVTTQEARDILMKGMDGLKESLLAQGVNVDNVLVKLEETDGEYKQDYTEQEGSRGGHKHQRSGKQKENGKDFEEMMFDLENEGNV